MSVVFLDVETGGLDPLQHQIIQLAAVAVDDCLNDIGSEFEVKVKLEEGRWTQEALDSNSYDPEVWEREAVPEAEARKRVDVFLRRFLDVRKISKKGTPYYVARIGAHNAPFDASFLGEFYRRGENFCPVAICEPLDTLALARWHTFKTGAKVKDHKLGTLCEIYGIPLFGAHDALADVRATVALARKITAEFLA